MTAEELKTRRREYQRRWLEKPGNRERAAEAHRRWVAEHRDHVNAYRRAWCHRNPEKVREAQRRWRETGEMIGIWKPIGGK